MVDLQISLDNMELQNFDRNISGYFTNETQPKDTAFFTVLYTMESVGLPVIVALGLLGNSVSMAVFLTRELRAKSSSVYTLAMLLSDVMFLVSLLTSYLANRGYISLHQGNACFVINCLALVSSFTSAWFAVCLLLENYISVCHPNYMMSCCTMRRACVVTGTLAVGPVPCFTVPLLFALNSQCLPNIDTLWVLPVLTLLECFLSHIFPICIVLVLCTSISRKLLRQKSPKCAERSFLSGARNARRPHVRVFFMLIVLCSINTLMRLPSYVIRSRVSIQFALGTLFEESHTDYILSSVCLFIYQLSFAVKFFAFFSVGKNFRRIVLRKVNSVLPFSYKKV